MQRDALGIELGGEITIHDLHDALGGFKKVLDALADEHNLEVVWELCGLSYGSVTAQATAVAKDAAWQNQIPKMYERFGETLKEMKRGPVDTPRPVHRALSDFIATANKSNPVTFHLNGEGRIAFTDPLPDWVARNHYLDMCKGVITSVRGRVDTVRYREPSFALYELVEDHRIVCHLNPGVDDRMRDIWGHIVDVTGRVSRVNSRGRTTELRDIDEIELVEEGDPDGYLQARGTISLSEPSEVLVRRMRDGE